MLNVHVERAIDRLIWLFITHKQWKRNPLITKVEMIEKQVDIALWSIWTKSKLLLVFRDLLIATWTRLKKCPNFPQFSQATGCNKITLVSPTAVEWYALTVQFTQTLRNNNSVSGNHLHKIVSVGTIWIYCSTV